MGLIVPAAPKPLTRHVRAMPEEDHRTAMLVSASEIYDALQRLKPGQTLTISRDRESERIRCLSIRLQAALRTIDETEPV